MFVSILEQLICLLEFENASTAQVEFGWDGNMGMPRIDTTRQDSGTRRRHKKRQEETRRDKKRRDKTKYYHKHKDICIRRPDMTRT